MRTSHDAAYLSTLRNVLRDGELTKNRTSTNCYKSFGEKTAYNLNGANTREGEGFPLLTTKKLNFEAIKAELLWFLSGSTNVKELKTLHKTPIWDAWANPETGELGPIYGKQWRDFGGVDQILQVQENLRKDPFSRRHIVSAWNPSEIKDMALPPCHAFFQFNVSQQHTLDLQLYQRSADLFLGVPYNVASYSLLVCMMSQCVGLKPGKFIHIMGDAHIYENHLEQVKTQLARLQAAPPSPILWLNPEVKSILDFKMEDVKIEEYNPMPFLKAEVSV